MKLLKLTYIALFLFSIQGFSQSNKVQSILKEKVAEITVQTDKPSHEDPVKIASQVVWSKDKKQLAVVMQVNV